MRNRMTILLATLGLVGSMATSGCSFQDSICGDGDYPILAVGVNNGSDCIPKGQEPPAGWVHYPEGKVPKHVDDEWDVYWRDHGIDEQGNIIDL
ncbi:SCO0607 family lipoprotein [Micromonospora yangpuensis]|nr:hypothetical protein [Micromonospora yangpuensis]GGL99071.1 lipoprotein [Micromonospora yangpuensis]